MREKIKDPGRICHMLDAARLLADEIPIHTLESIQENKVYFFGLAKLIEIIGEAAYKLTKEFKEAHPDMPWDSIIGMRHVMVHGYYNMSPQKIWATIVSDIPQIIPILERYTKELDSINYSSDTK